MKRVLKWLFIYGIFVIILAPSGIPIVSELSLLSLVLTFGWIGFLRDTLPRIHINGPDIWLACGVFLTSIAVLHGLARSIQRSMFASPKSGQANPPPWAIGRSILLSLSALIAFVAGVAIVGIAHQVAWLATSDKPLLESGVRHLHRQYHATSVAMQLAHGLSNHTSEHAAEFPAGATKNADGLYLHGWMTYLLPYLEEQSLYDAIDKHVPWRAQANAAHFRHTLAVFLNPRFHDSTMSRVNGFGAAHFATNQYVIGPGRPLKLADIHDGTSKTILGGEASTTLQPWGSTCNWRDPAVGLRTPLGFGRPPSSRGGTILMMCDGSYRTVSDDVDTRVLQAMSTPGGGETVSNDDIPDEYSR